MIDFLCSIEKYLPDDVIQQYLHICQINPYNFIQIEKMDLLKEEMDKFVYSCLYHTPIIKEILNYVVTKESKLDFLKKFSPEQIAYITNPDTTDTKLLACAGSGKTRSIIGRIKFLVDHNFVKKENVFVITFAKFTARDFHNKIQELFPDFESFALLKNFSTIDSLAKSILCKMKSHKSDNVEILSIAFRNYLSNISPEEIDQIKNIKNIKHLFVDEAQDLNPEQFDIICLIKKHFQATIHLIGDPNQNIFQFRRSNSSHLMSFVAKQYNLSLNFRSTQQIINFSECLKPIPTKLTQSGSAKEGPKPIILSQDSKCVHQIILQYISTYSGDLSEIAIICPTKGIKAYNTTGLSVFFNLFNLHKIPFKQLYDEAGSNDERMRDTDKLPGHLNLLTWHGTKGLEFDTVFVMDFYHHVFNIKPTEIEHSEHQYLLYVATTRAKRIMYCCIYTDVHSGYLNHWLSRVDLSSYIATNFKMAELSFRSVREKNNIYGITDIIAELSDVDLDRIDDMIKIDSECTFEKRIYDNFSDIDRNKNEALFGIFVEELFYLQYELSRKLCPRELTLIKQILGSNFIIVTDDSECNLLKNFITKNQMTWAMYDKIIWTIRPDIKNLVEKYFTRDHEMTNFIVCTNKFISIIKNNIHEIRRAYENYLEPISYGYDYTKIQTDFFYLIVVQYAYNNNHYYYIEHTDKSKSFLLETGEKLFAVMNDYVKYNYWGPVKLRIKKMVTYSKLMLIGEIDFIEKYPNNLKTVVDIKCCKEISIKHYLQVILYNFCLYWQTEPDRLYHGYFKILNLLTGIEQTVVYSITPAKLFDLMNTIAKAGNLKFSHMNLVYDLETTDKILFSSAMNPTQLQLIPRGRTWMKEGKYVAEIYPDIIEIAIRDYETKMIIINELVKPNQSINPEVVKLTGITDQMVINADSIHIIKERLDSKLSNFVNSKLLAHNGKCFDDKIVLYDKLIDPKKFTFMDTMSVIPIHMPINESLVKKSVTEIYKQLFDKTFVAHRAMGDVDALIKIMIWLNIQF